MKRILVLIAIGLLLAGLAGCGGGPGNIDGTVTQAKDPSRPLNDSGNRGDPLAGAEVSIYSLDQAQGSQAGVFSQAGQLETATTDEKGRFSFTVEPGAYQIKVRLNGQELGSHLVDVRKGSSASVRINVAPQP